MPIELICYGHSQRILFSSDSSKQLKTLKISWREAGLARYKKTFVLLTLLSLRVNVPSNDGIIADGVPQPEYSYAHIPTKALRERFGGGVGYPSISARIPA